MKILDDNNIPEIDNLASEINAIGLQYTDSWFCQPDPDDLSRMLIMSKSDDGGCPLAWNVEPRVADMIVKLHNVFWALYRMWGWALGVRSFHPRAWKLALRRQNFWVVSDEEPYYLPVGGMIREQERNQGTWTPDDEAFFVGESERIRAANRRGKKDGMDTRRKAGHKTR